MIALIVLVQKFTLGSAFCKLLQEIQETADAPQDLEIIAKFSSAEEQHAFRSYIQQAGFSFRALGISVIRHVEYVDQHADYNECYLQTLPGSLLLLPLSEHTSGFAKGWDTKLREQYEQSVKKLGHNIFTIQSAPLSTDTSLKTVMASESYVIAFTRSWLGIVGGFGIVAQLNAWTRGIHYYLRSTYEKTLAVILTKPIFNANYPPEDASALITGQFMLIMQQEAKSIHLSIESKKREKEIAHLMRNHDSISAMYALAEHAPIQKVYQHAFWRYVAETNPFIMSMHSLPLMDVMSSAALHKRKQLNLWVTPSNWIMYLAKWRMEDMRALPVENLPPEARNSKSIYYDMLKQDLRALLYRLRLGK